MKTALIVVASINIYAAGFTTVRNAVESYKTDRARRNSIQALRQDLKDYAVTALKENVPADEVLAEVCERAEFIKIIATAM